MGYGRQANPICGAGASTAARGPGRSWFPRFTGGFRDPRTVQMVLLGSIIAAGAWRYDVGVGLTQIALTVASAILAQLFFDRLAGQRSRSIRSPLVTSLSISILLRATSLWMYPAVAVAAIGSKYIIRVRGKHLFNPSCFGVIFALSLFPGVWVSPGQWGAGVAIAGWIVAAGAIVTARAASADISASFVVLYSAGLTARVLWYGQRWAVLIHQMSNGALLLFAFFMLSDPKTIPDSRRGRTVHAAAVAAIALILQFWLYANNALLWALFLAAPAVTIWNARWPAPQFTWNSEGENECAVQQM